MTLEDFERELAESKDKEERESKQKHRRRDSDTREERHHRHRHRSSRHHESRHDDEDGHRSKRRRRSRDEDDKHESRRRHRHKQRDHNDDEGADSQRRDSTIEEKDPKPTILKRDSWMEAPSSLDIDYIQRPQRAPSPPKNKSLDAQYELKVHEKELNHHLKDLHAGKSLEELELPAQHDVDYTFGDSGSQWRMTKLKAVYKQAEKTGQPVEDVALERYDSLREFDDAREEEIELGRRERYGAGYVGKEKPSGEIFQERKLDAGIRRSPETLRKEIMVPDEQVEEIAAPTRPITASKVLDQTGLNKLKAQIMKARLRRDPKLPQLEQEYEDAVAVFEANRQSNNVITLSAMDNRMLSSAPRNEVRAMTGGRNRERGNVEESEDMSIADMVAEERRTKGQSGGAAYRTAERIAKDAKFDNTEDYLDENATKLAKRVHKSDLNIRNTAIQDYQKLNRILDNCPLCHHEDKGLPPTAPVVSLATRTYLTLPTVPELSDGGAVIVPIEHRTNLLECDDDEWEEIRNFMKSLTRLYHDQGRDVIFYENAARPDRKPHAALNVVPLPYSLGETAPAFFQEAFLTSEEEWSQHKKIIDTLKKSKDGLGKLAFRRSMVKEAPYFHVWFEIDGGLGHIVEDANRWPKGDLFAREIVGGMLDIAPDVVKRQGRWERGHDSRVEGWRKKWRKFDWTRVLTEA